MLSAALSWAQPPGPAVSGVITRITGELYEFSVADQHSLFLVTPDGIVVADPLARDSADWLQREFQSRFPGRPVRYVLVTHYQRERAEGVSALFQTAEVIGHREFNDVLSRARRANSSAHRFAHEVETVFDDRKTVKIADDTVEMIHVGTDRAPDMSLLFFPRERAVFAVDPPPVTVVPFAFGVWKANDVFTWLHVVSALDFDVLIFGNGQRATRADVVSLRDYLDTLRANVSTLYEKGHSLDDVERLATIPAYASSPQYSSRRAQAAEIYRTLHLFRVDVLAAGVLNYVQQGPADYCAGYASCSAGGARVEGTGGLGLSFNRGVGISAEVTLGAQSWNSRLNPNYAEEVAVRQSRATVLFRYAPLSPHSTGYAVVAGFSGTRADIKGANRLDGALLPAGGRHLIEERSLRYGVTVGADLTQAVSRGVRLYLPVRFTRFSGDASPHWPGTWDVQMGVGFRFGLVRQVN